MIAIRMYQLPVMKSEIATTIRVGSGSCGAHARRLLGDLDEDVGEDRHDERANRGHDEDRDHEDRRRVHHRRADLAPQRVEALELVRDAVERLLEAARALACLNHRAVERVEDSLLGLHRLGDGAPRLDVLAKGDDRLREHLVVGLVFQRVERAQHRHARRDEGRELAREDRQRTRLHVLEALEDRLELERLARLGNVQDDQATLAELLGDGRLGGRLDLAA